MIYKKIKFKKFTDGRGDLIPIEFIGDIGNPDIPFRVKRCYIVSDPTNDAIRGQHAHRNLEQVIICLHGAFTLTLDNGSKRVDLRLDRDNEGIYIKDRVWRELKDFSENCVILVLASQHYNENDYIRDYEDFKGIIC